MATGADPETLLIKFGSSLAGDRFFFVAFLLILIPIIHIALRESPLKVINDYLPKSSVFIIVGIAVGGLVAIKKHENREAFIGEIFDSKTILNFLLPPIILNSVFHTCNRDFALQIDGILMFAVIGTLFNIIAFGFTIYALGLAGVSPNVPLIEALLFSSIISAVDPVAIIALFEEIKVPQTLHNLVFGESLFNDGVALVAYSIVRDLANVDLTDEAKVYLCALFSFVTVGLGGFIVGATFGFLASVLCSITSGDKMSHFLDVSVLFSFVAFSYAMAAYLGWSGIISVIGCGVTEKRYGFKCLHNSAKTAIVTILAAVAIGAENLIFLLFGMEVFEVTSWNFLIIAWTILFIVVFRFLSTFWIGLMINQLRIWHKLTTKQLIIISYGGLRGAATFAMANDLEDSDRHSMFKSAALAVVIFTCFVQGGTSKFLLNILNIESGKVNAPKSMLSEITKEVGFHSIQGLAGILSPSSQKLLTLCESLEAWDHKYVQCLFERKQNALIHQSERDFESKRGTAFPFNW